MGKLTKGGMNIRWLRWIFVRLSKFILFFSEKEIVPSVTHIITISLKKIVRSENVDLKKFIFYREKFGLVLIN